MLCRFVKAVEFVYTVDANGPVVGNDGIDFPIWVDGVE